MSRLSPYDIECGIQIDAAFAAFQGRDADRDLARVFAAVVHRRTRGVSDGTKNPFGAEGAGWIGFAGLAGGTRLGAHTTDETTVFATTLDGCRVAALMLQEREFSPVQAAYRARDAVRLARALETSPMGASIDLTGLADEVAGVRQKWWSVVADVVRFRHVRGAVRARPR